jgi:toxin ParE1/3/4
MLPLNWSLSAISDLETITDYIEQYCPRAADNLKNDIVYAVSQLPFHPFLYRQGRVNGTREMVVHPNYLVVYAIHTASLDIISVLHARQDYP